MILEKWKNDRVCCIIAPTTSWLKSMWAESVAWGQHAQSPGFSSYTFKRIFKVSNIPYKEIPGGTQVTYWVEEIDRALQEASKKLQLQELTMRKQKESSRDSKYFPLGFKENLSENAGEKIVRSRDSHLSKGNGTRSSPAQTWESVSIPPGKLEDHIIHGPLGITHRSIKISDIPVRENSVWYPIRKEVKKKKRISINVSSQWQCWEKSYVNKSKQTQHVDLETLFWTKRRTVLFQGSKYKTFRHHPSKKPLIFGPPSWLLLNQADLGISEVILVLQSSRM